MNHPAKIRVLFVCLGNICRSPTAEIVFRQLVAKEAPELDVELDSAGTGAYHVGAPPDARTQEAARRRGYDMSALRARVVELRDFDTFDFILAMDRSTQAILHRTGPRSAHSRVRLFMEFAPETGAADVPDPYYGGANGFEEVLDLVESASRGLLAHLLGRGAA